MPEEAYKESTSLQ